MFAMMAAATFDRSVHDHRPHAFEDVADDPWRRLGAPARATPLRILFPEGDRNWDTHQPRRRQSSAGRLSHHHDKCVRLRPPWPNAVFSASRNHYISTQLSGIAHLKEKVGKPQSDGTDVAARHAAMAPTSTPTLWPRPHVVNPDRDEIALHKSMAGEHVLTEIVGAQGVSPFRGASDLGAEVDLFPLRRRHSNCPSGSPPDQQMHESRSPRDLVAAGSVRQPPATSRSAPLGAFLSGGLGATGASGGKAMRGSSHKIISAIICK